MSDWKYVMFEANGQMMPIIFPPALIHEDVADAVHRVVRQHVIDSSPGNWSSRIVSAGFLSGMIVTGTHGKSESLNNLAAREEDRKIINNWPYCSGMEGGIDVEAMVIEAVKRGLA